MGIDEMINDFIRECCPTSELWEVLAQEGKFELIDRLRRVEMGEDGYHTIVVPKKGFSENDKTHNLVLDWLEEHRVNVMNIRKEVFILKEALHSDKRRTNK